MSRVTPGFFSLRTSAALLSLCLVAMAGPGGAVDLGDLNVPSSRIPEWHAFDETNFVAAKSWPEFDVTCASAPCGSGKQPYTNNAALSTCSTVSTGAFGNIQCHITKAPNNSVLYLPAGTYAVGGAMKIGRSNVVIRGAGRSSTVLRRSGPGRDAVGGDCDGNSGATIAAVCGPNWSGGSTTWTGGYAPRTNTVNVGNASLFTTGGWIRLRMSGSTACVHMDETLNSGGEADGFVHIAKVLNVNGNAVTMDRGLRMDYAAAGCSGHQAVAYAPVENVGLENLRFTSNTSVPVCGGSNCIVCPFVTFTGAANAWLVGSRLDRAWEMWADIHQAARIWVQGNDFDDLDETIIFNTEGLYMREGAVDVVTENNTCSGARNCQKTDNGAEGNVYAYNYTRQSQTACEKAYSNHGHYVRENLFEGNDIDCEVMLTDRYWGRNGPRITAYRNRNVSNTCDRNTDMFTVNGDGGGAYATGADVNIIGNTSAQFGTSPVFNNPRCPPSNTAPMSNIVDRLWVEKNAWRLPGGTFAVGSANDRSCGTGPNDTCPGTNFNVSAPHSSWSGSYPTSLYRTSKPSWWCNEACDWSQNGIGAFGDDFGAGLCKLPAQIRSEGGTCTLPDGTQSTPELLAPVLLPTEVGSP
jgi:hypothetical protein